MRKALYNYDAFVSLLKKNWGKGKKQEERESRREKEEKNEQRIIIGCY